MGKMLPVQARTVCFVATRDEHPQAWPGTGGYKSDQVQLLLFRITNGKVHVHHTCDCFSIFNCLMLFNSKKNTDTFFVDVGEHCLLVKEENTKTLDVFLQTSLHLKGFKAWVYFLRKALKTKEKGKSVTKGINEPRGED